MSCGGVPRKIASKEDVRTRLAELSGWQTATRNDGAVAKTLQDTRAMDQISPLREAAFFDELFHYIREIGARDLLETLDPKDREGAAYPFIQFVLCTIIRCVGGVQSMLATQEVLATDEALMGWLGFNAAQVQQGRNDRGVSCRTTPVEIRGAFSFETVADNRVTIGPARLAELLNGAIRYTERIERVQHGSGQTATVEERKTVVVGIRDLPCDWWKPGGSTSAANAKDFRPKLINATVVLRWDGAPKDAEKEVVILTPQKRLGLPPRQTLPPSPDRVAIRRPPPPADQRSPTPNLSSAGGA